MMEYLSVLMLSAALALGQTGGQAGVTSVGRITTAVAAAKRQGLSEISITAPVLLPTGVNTLEMVADNYSVFLAEPVSAVVSASPHGLITWYTLRTDEVVIRQRADGKGNDFAPPFPLQSLESGQLLLPVGGGQATIDGIIVREEPSLNLQLSVGKKYLLVLYLQQGGRIGELAAQADGVFEISQDGSSIRSLRASSRLGHEVQTSWAGQLDPIRTFLKGRASAQR